MLDFREIVGTKMNNKKVLIAGAGIAGLTLAYWLKKYGFNPTLIEKHKSLRTEGYKLDIRGAAVDVVKRMGLYPVIDQSKTDIQRALFVDRDGKIVTEMTPDLCGVRAEGDLEIVRGDLCQILFQAVGEIECLFDNSIASLSENEKGVHVTFEKGGPCLYDLVIGADGLHSKVRQLGFGDESKFLKELGIYISFYSIPNYLGLDRVEVEYHLQSKFAIAYCPAIGMAKAGFAFSSEPLKLDRFDKDKQQKLMQEVFQDAGWEVPRFLELMKEAPDFYFDCMAQVQMPKWTNGRLALVGDAAYAVSPIAGQGASVALVGSFVLAGELLEAGGDYHKAFERYEEALRLFIKENQGLAQMSQALMKGGSTSWIQAMLYGLVQFLARILPGNMIQFFKKIGLKRTTKAAQAINLKKYQIF